MLRDSTTVDSGEAIYLTESYAETLAPIDRTGDILSRLNARDRHIVMSRAVMKNFGKNEPLFTQGRAYDGIFIIKSGKVRAYYTSPAGREYTLAFWTPGHFCGVPEVYGTGENLWSAETVAPRNTLAVLACKDIRWLIHHVPAFSMALVEGLVYKGRCLSAALQMLGTRSMTSRLAQLLLTLAVRHGVRSGSHVRIEEPLTHDELAKFIGSTRQWVSTTIKQFRLDGLIDYSDQHINILDSTGLKNLLR
jgi:CRP/FNR family transcriptional regulator, cyclic AMP receptor protein